MITLTSHLDDDIKLPQFDDAIIQQVAEEVNKLTAEQCVQIVRGVSPVQLVVPSFTYHQWSDVNTVAKVISHVTEGVQASASQLFNKIIDYWVDGDMTYQIYYLLARYRDDTGLPLNPSSITDTYKLYQWWAAEMEVEEPMTEEEFRNTLEESYGGDTYSFISAVLVNMTTFMQKYGLQIAIPFTITLTDTIDNGPSQDDLNTLSDSLFQARLEGNVDGVPATIIRGLAQSVVGQISFRGSATSNSYAYQQYAANGAQPAHYAICGTLIIQDRTALVAQGTEGYDAHEAVKVMQEAIMS